MVSVVIIPRNFMESRQRIAIPSRKFQKRDSKGNRNVEAW